MTIKAIPLVQGVQLGTSAAAQYTCPANSIVIIRHAVFVNTTSGAITVTAYIVPQGGSVGDPTTILKAFSIAADTAYVSPELANIVLGPNDTLQCLASAGSSISLTASGLLQS